MKTRPSKGDRVSIRETEHTKQYCPEMIGETVVVLKDSKDAVPYQVKGTNLWLHESDVYPGDKVEELNAQRLAEEEAARKKAEEDEAARKKAEEEEAARKAQAEREAAWIAAEDVKDSPPPSSTCEFTIKLTKEAPDAQLGCRLLKSDDGEQLVVLAATGKPMDDWHKNNPTKTVLPGDQIISVSGTSGGVQSLIDAMKKSQELDIKLKRQLQVAVEVTKGETFGMTLDDNNKVTKIIEGPVKKFNINAKPTEQIFVGDQFCGVNGATENLAEETKKLTAGTSAKLIFKRPKIE